MPKIEIIELHLCGDNSMFKKIAIMSCLTLLSITNCFSVNNLDSLLSNERNTIEIFQQASPKVIFVHRYAMILNHALHHTEVPAGAGSGFIWDSKGHIVTNFHVIKGADKVSVSIGKNTFPAKVIGVEPRKDIAVLKLTSTKALSLLQSFTPFEIAHTPNLLVGQKTVAIGNPFGLDHSLTVGVISAVGREMPGIGGVTIRDMVQTDASINPGNSGGPLLDSAGRLIGMNTLIFSQSGSSSGVGFAVPADDIYRVVNQIIKNGRVVLAGIGIQRLDPSIASRLGVTRGVLIGDILPNTPAHKAGLIKTHRQGYSIILGDTIVALNGHPTPNYDTLYNLLTDINVGDKVELTILRNGKTMNVAMKTFDIAAVY
jgi:S1-C subfamily serine protease